MNRYVISVITKVLEILANVFPIFKISYGGKSTETGKVAEKK